MPFCSNCGFKITKEANFCPECGYQIKAPQAVKPAPPEESIPIKEVKPPVVKPDKAYTILEHGSLFNNRYRIEKIIGRDNDGVSYLAMDENCGEPRSLKLFYQSYFDNVSRLLGSITHLSRVRDIAHKHIARVYEVNQSHKPVFIASEYIEGISLARIKDQSPEQLNETVCRTIAEQLADVAIAVRKAGLSIRTLNLQNIIRREDDDIVVLSTGISYEQAEEKEDIFSFGILLAKLFSTSAFYETLYTPKKLADKRFEFISGITNPVNEIIAKSISRKYSGFAEVAKALKNLKPFSKDDIYYSTDSEIPTYRDKDELAMPKRRLDIYFWLMIVFIITFIFILMTTNLLDTIFGHNKTQFRFTGFMTTVQDTTDELASVAQDNYRKIPSMPQSMRRRIDTDDLNVTPNQSRVNPNINIPPSQPIFGDVENTPEVNVPKTQPQTIKRVNLPSNAEGLVYIYGDTYPYGSLKKDARDNVSLNGYYIGRAEITQAEWNKYIKGTSFSVKGENLPADNMSWYDAVQYCNLRSEAEGLTPCYKILGTATNRVVTCNFKANGYRLPTEAEWEYAARANSFTRYSGANDPDQIAWYKSNAQAHIHLIKTRDSNAFGLYDMTGNVSEWCWDWHDAGYIKSMPFINPTGPDSGTYKSIRGGSIDNSEGTSLEILYRYKGLPGKGIRHNGFRVVRSK